MAAKFMGISMPKWHYSIGGLTEAWDWYEFEGEVYALSEDDVRGSLEEFVYYDFESMEVCLLEVSSMAGEYLWPADGTTPPSIVYDEGPLPSWLEPAAEGVPWTEEDNSAKYEEWLESNRKAAAKANDVDWLDASCYSAPYLVPSRIGDAFTDAVEVK